MKNISKTQYFFFPPLGWRFRRAVLPFPAPGAEHPVSAALPRHEHGCSAPGSAVPRSRSRCQGRSPRRGLSLPALPGPAPRPGAAQRPCSARPRSSSDRQQTSGTGAPRLPARFPARGGTQRAGSGGGSGAAPSSPCPPPCYHLLAGAERPGSPPFTSPWRPGPAPATHPERGAAGEGKRGGRRQRRGASGCSRAPETSWRGPLSRTARGGGEGHGAPGCPPLQQESGRAASGCWRCRGRRLPALLLLLLLPPSPSLLPAGPAASAGSGGGARRPRRPLAAAAGDAAPGGPAALVTGHPAPPGTGSDILPEIIPVSIALPSQ